MNYEISRKILVDAVKLIKQWHDFPLPVETAPEEMFKIYYEIAPEMKSIREVLGPYDAINNEPQTTEQTDLPAENTVMWWLCRIADEGIRRKAVGNCENGDAKAINFNLRHSFVWLNTPEGHEYWSRIHYKEIPLLPTPEWKEYLELRK